MRLLFAIIAFSLYGYIQGQIASQGFVPNKGQWGEDDPSIARAEIPNGMMYLLRDRIRIYQTNPNDAHKKHLAHHYQHHKDSQFLIRHEVFDIFFGPENNNPIPQNHLEFQNPIPVVHNYFFGKEPKNWIPQLTPFNTVIIKEVYSNIDVKFYFNDNQIEFDWILKPRANPKQIKIKFSNPLHGNILSTGNLKINTTYHHLEIKKPIAYYRTSTQKNKPISCKYQKNSAVEYSLNINKYDTTQPIVIDPILVFSTYSGSKGDNFGFTATYDTAGCLYAGGIVDAETRPYPVTTGAFQTVYGGSGAGSEPVYLACDVSISKYSPDGTKLLYATYLGGSDDEYPHSLFVDPQNNLLVLGTTLSNNFPIHRDSNVQNSNKGGYDIFISKLSNNGSQLLAGTYIGGNNSDGFQDEFAGSPLIYNYADNYRGDITTDNKGNIYIATCTRSTNFPTTTNAYQRTSQGSTDAVVLSLTPNLSKFRWSTLLGGIDDDAAYSIKIDDSAHVYVGGGTYSVNFPMLGNSYKKSLSFGNVDGFIVRMRQNDGLYQQGTFFGTDVYDQIYFIDLDPNGKVFFTGQTEGIINRSAGTYGKNNTSQFIGRFNKNLDQLELITTFGNRTTNSPELSPSAFMVDNCHNIYFSGWGSNIGAGNAGTTSGLPTTNDAHQRVTDNNDFYLIVLGKDAKSLKYASFFGGNRSDDHVDGGTSRFDNRGIIYQSVCASCPDNPPGLNDFPTSPANVAFKNNVSVRCSNASFKLDFRLGYSIDAQFQASPRVTCFNSPISFKPIRNFAGATYIWDFGDGDTSHKFNPTHTYKTTGKFIVKLLVIDSNSCNAKATQIDSVSVFYKPTGTVSYSTSPCKPGVLFQITASNADSVRCIWDDKSDTITQPIKDTLKTRHFYEGGNYLPKFIIISASGNCNDTLSIPITVNTDSIHEVKIANVFTPNNDGKNDCFKVLGLSPDCDEAELLIFNRWGERIFQTKDFNNCWNGKVNNDGPELPEGTYFYQLEIIKSEAIHPKKLIEGTINLLR